MTLPSYFGCLFDIQEDSFLCKLDDFTEGPSRNLEGMEASNHHLIVSKPSIDPELLDNERAILQRLELENCKELPEMRFYTSVCKGFPKHGVRGKSFWSKASFKDAKFTQKLQQHGIVSL